MKDVRNEILCIIPARGGSKSIPNKNISNFEGKPLLAWTIEAAKASNSFSRIIVSTDSIEIAHVAQQWGAEVPYIRSAELASDNVHAVHVVLDALDWHMSEEGFLPEGVMMLLPTSPLRLADDILGVIELYIEQQALSVISVVDLGKYKTNLRYLEEGVLSHVSLNEDVNQQRQGQKKLYSVNGSIFLARSAALIKEKTFHVDGAHGYLMDPVNSIDINTTEDLILARKFFMAFEPWTSKKNLPK
jgi:CMP-N,N'-diacetyllegionaminic acid synthase